MDPKKRGARRHREVVVDKIQVMKRVCDHESRVDRRQYNDQDAYPCLILKRRTDKVQDEPDNAERDDADQYHTQRIDDREMIQMAYHRRRVQQCPYKNRYTKDKKAAEPPVAHIAEPEQTQDIGDCAAY